MKQNKCSYNTEKITKKIKNTLNDRLTDLVNDKKKFEGISQSKQAEDMDMSQSSLSKYLNAETEIQATALYKLADYYNRSMDYLTGRIEETSINNEEIAKLTGLSDKALSVLSNVIEMKHKDFTMTYKLLALNFIIENFSNSDFLFNLYKFLFATFVFKKNDNDYYYATPIEYLCVHNEESAIKKMTSILDQKDMSALFFARIQQDIHEFKSLLEKKQEEENGEHSRKKK